VQVSLYHHQLTQQFVDLPMQSAVR